MLGVEEIRQLLKKAGDVQGVRLLSAGMVEQQGYKVVKGKVKGKMVKGKVVEGKMVTYLVGPTGYPEGPPPQPGSMVPIEDDSTPTDAGGSGSLSGARRQVTVTRDYADWAAFVRRQDIWEQYQEERAWLLGKLLINECIGASSLPTVRDAISKQGDPVLTELWSDSELRADYPGAYKKGMTSTAAAVV